MAEKKKDKDDGSVAVKPKKKSRRKPTPRKSPTKLMPLWKVLLHNDDVNTFEYVIATIRSLTPLTEIQAIRCTIEAHKTGLVLLLTTHRERAELYQQQFQSKRLTVTIEPEERG